MPDDRPRNLYLIVRNGGNFAMIYCASAGLEGRIRQGQSQYFPDDSEVFVIGTASEIVSTGKLGLLVELPHSTLEHLRGVPPGEPGEILSLDRPKAAKPKRPRKKR